MSSIEIINLIASIAAMLSAVFAAVSCILHYRFIKPKIRLRVNQPHHRCQIIYFQYPNGVPESTAFMHVSIYNASSVAGTIGSIEILYNHTRRTVETVGANYNPKWLTINPFGALNQDPDVYRLRVPLTVQPYTAITGYFLIPNFPPISGNTASVTVEYKCIDGKMRTRRIKNIEFVDITNTANLKLIFRKEIRDYIIKNNQYNIEIPQTVSYPCEYKTDNLSYYPNDMGSISSSTK